MGATGGGLAYGLGGRKTVTLSPSNVWLASRSKRYMEQPKPPMRRIDFTFPFFSRTFNTCWDTSEMMRSTTGSKMAFTSSLGESQLAFPSRGRRSPY